MFILIVMDQEGNQEFFGPFNTERGAKAYAEKYQKSKEEMHTFEVERLLPPVPF